jgi:uncharacterized protein (DUF697 family)
MPPTPMPSNLDKLDQVRGECRSMVLTRALLAAASAAIPVPVLDVAATTALLLQLLPEINKRFGLDADQMDQYSIATKDMIYRESVGLGNKVVGSVITDKVMAELLGWAGARFAVEQVAKYIVPPVAGAAAACVHFLTMEFIGNSHVEDCYKVVKRVKNY